MLVHDNLLNRNDKDLLKHMDDEVDGVDSMQVYLKKHKGGTGKHQENENLCAVNISCSDGSSDWTCVSGKENIDKAFKLIADVYKFDARIS